MASLKRLGGRPVGDPRASVLRRAHWTKHLPINGMGVASCRMQARNLGKDAATV